MNVNKEEALDVWRKGMGGEVTPQEVMEVNETISRWLSRGDEVLVYQNVELAHPEAGHVQLVSYGSGFATIQQSVFERPPTTMPDFPGRINWRYQLIGIVSA